MQQKDPRNELCPLRTFRLVNNLSYQMSQAPNLISNTTSEPQTRNRLYSDDIQGLLHESNFSNQDQFNYSDNHIKDSLKQTEEQSTLMSNDKYFRSGPEGLIIPVERNLNMNSIMANPSDNFNFKEGVMGIEDDHDIRNESLENESQQSKNDIIKGQPDDFQDPDFDRVDQNQIIKDFTISKKVGLFNRIFEKEKEKDKVSVLPQDNNVTGKRDHNYFTKYDSESIRSPPNYSQIDFHKFQKKMYNVIGSSKIHNNKTTRVLVDNSAVLRVKEEVQYNRQDKLKITLRRDLGLNNQSRTPSFPKPIIYQSSFNEVDSKDRISFQDLRLEGIDKETKLFREVSRRTTEK